MLGFIKTFFIMYIRQLKFLNNIIIIRTLSSNKNLFKSSKLIRNDFLEYFSKNLNHAFIRSSPVLPLNDPSIPFVNAGMNQFKGVFLGEHNPPALRVVNSQKCIRVGGKHNDLEIVGHDPYHHTFFEMLGNWSFGDYFKEEACKNALDLLIEIYGIKKDFLYVTYFSGNEKLNLKPDLECKEIWLKLGIPEDHILPFGIEYNFWEMGPTGPCGPCTEIHIDHTMQLKNQALRVNKGYDDLTELWNIVFIQFRRLKNGQITPLIKNYVDTGMGFERLVSVLQGKRSNYDTDLFQPLFEAIETLSHAPKYQGRFGIADRDKIDSGYRILSDHARMVTVALADGMLPDKNHKLRRVLRKAIDIGDEIFRTNKLLSELSYHVALSLGDVYPEIYKNLNKIQYIIQYEEEVMKSARCTALKHWKKIVCKRPELSIITDTTLPGLSAGYNQLQQFLKSEYKGDSLPGHFAYKLYDTYGLNMETIHQLSDIESVKFDINDFKETLEKVREQSRYETDKLDCEIISDYSLNLLESANVPKTDDLLKYNHIYSSNGYNFPKIKCKLLGIVINGNLISEIESKLNVDESQAIVEGTITSSGNIIESSAVINTNSEVGIILDKTNAYSPAGGQISDKGQIQVKNLLFNFEKVRKIRDYVIHIGHFVDWDELNLEQELEVGDECVISINDKNRVGAMRHHTAIHLLNAALQKILPVIGQRGSSVQKDILHFECSVFGKKLSTKDVMEIENLVNQTIQANVPVKTKVVNILEMLNENNLSIIPGEIYPDSGIRIIEINSNILNSKEACCGTHVHETGVIEHFCIVSLKSRGTLSISLKAVTGSIARLTRLAGDNLKDRISKLENDFKIGSTTLKDLEYKINIEKLELLDKKKRFPYIVVQESLEKLEMLSKHIKIQERGKTRNSIEEEIKKLLESSSLPFVVHCLQPNNAFLENISLKNIIKLCPPTTPVLIIIYCKNKAKARCCVPQEVQSPSFNAKIWMEEVLQIFQSKGNSLKDENPLVAYNMLPTQISNDNFNILIDKAIANAIKFASTYLDRSKKNKPNK